MPVSASSVKDMIPAPAAVDATKAPVEPAKRSTTRKLLIGAAGHVTAAAGAPPFHSLVSRVYGRISKVHHRLLGSAFMYVQLCDKRCYTLCKVMDL